MPHQTQHTAAATAIVMRRTVGIAGCSSARRGPSRYRPRAVAAKKPARAAADHPKKRTGEES
jgi:hypothetical protein